MIGCAPRRVVAVIPTWQEAAVIGELVMALRDQVGAVIVVDAGSPDGTSDVARSAGAEVIQGVRGRGPQLNAGAAAAGDAVLWFLHADSGVPSGAGAAVGRAAQRALWGCCGVRIDSADPRLWVTSAMMGLRARLTGCCTGDMGIWCRSSFFAQLGGYRALAAFEDLDFTDRARACADPEVADVALCTSARRWQVEGINRTVLKMWALRAGYRLGMPPERLAQMYRSAPR